MLIRSYMPGTCFLCRLQITVHRFPLWSALPPLSTISGSDSRKVFGVPPGTTYLEQSRNLSDLPSSQRLYPYMPRSLWTPTDLQDLTFSGPFVLASGTLTPWPSASFLRGCIKLQGVRSPLRPTWFPGYASHGSFGLGASSPCATLGTGGWLGLSRPGLPPGKRRQASLGALTVELSGARHPDAFAHRRFWRPLY